jgi:hypothetical protein
MTEAKNGKWFPVAMFLAGALLSGSIAGVGGIVRGDWLGARAAQEVKLELKEDVQSIERRVEKRLDRIEAKLDEALNR